MAVPWGGLLLSSLIPTPPNQFTSSWGGNPWQCYGEVCFLAASILPHPSTIIIQAQDPRASYKEMEEIPALEDQKPGPLLCLSVVIAIVVF